VKQNTVERVSRRVIENKLLVALQDKDTVAVLFSKEDLEDMIASLYGYVIGDWKGSVLSWHEHLERRNNLAKGLTELRDSAFPKST
jgi:hypothetical protein